MKGDVQLVFITPENLLANRKFREMLLSTSYLNNLIALVDEAHCVNTWEDNFREAFKQIGDVHCLILSTFRVLANTATAATETYYVVTKRDNPKLIALPPYRNNICYVVKPKCEPEFLVN